MQFELHSQWIIFSHWDHIELFICYVNSGNCRLLSGTRRGSTTKQPRTVISWRLVNCLDDLAMALVYRKTVRGLKTFLSKYWLCMKVSYGQGSSKKYIGSAPFTVLVYTWQFNRRSIVRYWFCIFQIWKKHSQLLCIILNVWIRNRWIFPPRIR